MPDPKKRTQNSLGKENLKDKLPKNAPKRKVRESTAMTTPNKGGAGMKGTMRRTQVRRTRGA